MNRMQNIHHLLLGALTLQLRGDNIHHIIGVLQQNEVRMQHVRMKNGQCTLTLSLRDFPICYTLCRQYKVKMRFKKRLGLPFLLRRMRRRKAFVGGFIVFVVLIFIMSSMVWRVNIQANDEDTIASVQQAARDAGLYVGAWRNAIPDPLILQKKILEKVPSVVWVGVAMDGSVATLQAVEKIPGVETANTTPHNIGAAKPGVILQVYATRGQVLVKPGQVVKPGDIMISGDLSNGIKKVPASGSVLAEVWYTSKVEIPLQVAHDGLTGLSFTRDYLDLGGFGIRVWGWKQPNYTASVDRTERTAWHFGSFALPIQWRAVTEFEVDKASESFSQQVAEKQALQLAIQDVRAQMGNDARVLGQTVLQAQVAHGKLYETVLTRTEENIGVALPIPPTPEPLAQKNTAPS